MTTVYVIIATVEQPAEDELIPLSIRLYDSYLDLTQRPRYKCDIIHSEVTFDARGQYNLFHQ
jgi:hypothetical protein